MVDWRSQFARMLVSAPLLCSGFVGGIASMPEGSCLTSALISPATSRESEAEPSFLIRDYFATDKGDLVYSMRVMERLWTYFVDEAESFSPQEVAVIDKEFWNLG